MKRVGWMERMLLRGFEPEERAEIVRDVAELAGTRRGLRRTYYYWVELAKYPFRALWDARLHPSSDDRSTASGPLHGLLHDARYACRSLVRAPAFLAASTGIITLGLGSTAAMFSVVEGVLLSPLPFTEPDRLVSIWLSDDAAERARMTPGNFQDVAALDDALLSVAAFRGQGSTLLLEGRPVFLRGGAVTTDYFSTLGVELAAGRGFTADEGEAGGESVVVLSHHVWEQMFGADPSIVGRTIELDGGYFEVVGVAPSGLYPTSATVAAEIPFTSSRQDFFVPLRFSEGGWANRRSHLLGMIGRIPDGSSIEFAQERLAVLAARLRSTEPLNRDNYLLVTPFQDEVVGSVRAGLFTLLLLVGLVLLIAVVNVAALFVLRADERAPDARLRSALGAPRSRLVRQVVIESVIVTTLSSLAAVVVARGGITAMQGLVPYQIPRLTEVQVGASVLAGVCGVGVAVGVGFAVVPGIRLLRETGLGGSGSRHTAGRRRKRFQAAVVGVQAALCVIVLSGAALLSRSYQRLTAVDTGFTAHEAWAMSVPASADALEEIVRRVRSLPGVRAAGLTYDHPLERNWGDGFSVVGVVRSESDPPSVASLRPFGEGYFESVGLAAVEGRIPSDGPTQQDLPYALVNEAFADRFLPEGRAVGSQIMLPTARRMFELVAPFEVIGVVRDVRFLGPDQPPAPGLYVPLAHFPASATTLIVRPEVDDLAVVAPVRAAIAQVDASLGVQDAQRLEDILDDLRARPRFNMLLVLWFGAVGLVLCGMGAYGLVASTVRGRTREIGVQIALGASAPRLSRRIIAVAVQPVFVGGVVGMLLSLVLARGMRSMLYEVSPEDPASLIVSIAFVLSIAVLAAVVPARRALTVDPAASLRGE